jgi:hypothetical protein
MDLEGDTGETEFAPPSSQNHNLNKDNDSDEANIEESMLETNINIPGGSIVSNNLGREKDRKETKEKKTKKKKDKEKKKKVKNEGRNDVLDSKLDLL